MRIFLKAGAYPNVRDNMNRTALSYACMKGREDIVQHLMKEDILEVDCPDNDGNTPLAHAALSGNPNIVRELVTLLVRFGNGVDGRNNLGYTPLLLAAKYAHYVSAHILLVQGNASPMLRDNEFFLNATDWVNRSAELQQSLVRQRGRMLPALTTFNRENTLYRQCSSYAPVCRHFTPPSHPLGQSLDSALSLPAVFGYFPVESPAEQVIEGSDARLVLLGAIAEVTSQPRTRPTSRVSSTGAGRRQYPATPKLLALGGRRSQALMVPDMKTLFKMYSDQYEVRASRERQPALMASPSVDTNSGSPGDDSPFGAGNYDQSPIVAWKPHSQTELCKYIVVCFAKYNRISRGRTNHSVI